jgi:hypothetical protein
MEQIREHPASISEHHAASASSRRNMPKMRAAAGIDVDRD